MPRKDRYQNRIELLQGTLDLLILQTLEWGAQHGYGISQAIRSNSGDVLQVDTGSLYPALHRLERQRWISSQWKVSDNKQRVKVYRLTTAGKKQLLAEHSRWAQLVEAMAGELNPAKREACRGRRWGWGRRGRRGGGRVNPSKGGGARGGVRDAAQRREGFGRPVVFPTPPPS